MEGEKPISPEPPKIPEREATEEKPAPSIRTMKTDEAELFKNTRPSLLQFIKQTAPAEEKHIASYAARPQSATWIWILTALAAVGAAYFLFFPKSQPPLPVKPVPPPAFFSTDVSRTITVSTQDRVQFLRLMQDAVEEKEAPGTLKRILLKLQDGPNERYATLFDFLNLYRINSPPNFLDQIENPLTLFSYYESDGPRFGFAIESRDPERTLRGMLDWENSLLRDFNPFFFGEKPEAVIAPFEDRTYRNLDWRFLKLSQTKDLGIGYLIFPSKNYLIVATSRESVETIINRLVENR